MNKAMGPLWQYMGQQQPAQSPQGGRQPYMAALERKRRRQQAKQQTQQQEAQILPMGPPQQMQPFSNFLTENTRSQYPTNQAGGMQPWVAALRART